MAYILLDPKVCNLDIGCGKSRNKCCALSKESLLTKTLSFGEEADGRGSSSKFSIALDYRVESKELLNSLQSYIIMYYE